MEGSAIIADFLLRGVLPPSTLSSGIWCRALLGGLHPRPIYLVVLVYLLLYPSRGLTFCWYWNCGDMALCFAGDWALLANMAHPLLPQRTAISPHLRTAFFFYSLFRFFLSLFSFFSRLFFLILFIYTYVTIHPLYNSNK